LEILDKYEGCNSSKPDKCNIDNDYYRTWIPIKLKEEDGRFKFIKAMVYIRSVHEYISPPCKEYIDAIRKNTKEE